MSEYQEIKRRCEKATRGQWKFGDAASEGEYFDLKTTNPTKDEYGHDINVISAVGQSSDSFWLQNSADIEFIEHSRTDIPLLLKALELVCDDPNMGGEPDYWVEKASKEMGNGNYK